MASKITDRESEIPSRVSRDTAAKFTQSVSSRACLLGWERRERVPSTSPALRIWSFLCWSMELASGVTLVLRSPSSPLVRGGLPSSPRALLLPAPEPVWALAWNLVSLPASRLGWFLWASTLTHLCLCSLPYCKLGFSRAAGLGWDVWKLCKAGQVESRMGWA